MKSNNGKSKLITVALVAVGLYTTSLSVSAADPLFTLKNLERERAALVASILDADMDPEQRQQKLRLKQRQLVDIERMVLRDERLLKSKSNLVTQAFNNYDLTFLVHAGAEKNMNATQQWLSQVKLTNQSILDSQVGFR